MESALLGKASHLFAAQDSLITTSKDESDSETGTD